jgi:nucleoid-associated protein YgaU
VRLEHHKSKALQQEKEITMWPFGKSTEDRLKDALKEYPMIAGWNMNVSVEGDTAKFSGEVPNKAGINLVTAVAEGISGIKHVDTTLLSVPAAEIVDVPDAPAFDASVAMAGMSDDVMVSAAVNPSALAKGAFKAISNNVELKDNPIDVLQSGTRIILRGAVDSQHEYNLARNLAQAIDGVSEVDLDGLRIIEHVKELVSQKDEHHNVTYTVKSGDTLSAIAQRYFGDASEYGKIAQANGIDNPDHIQVGQVLTIPTA